MCIFNIYFYIYIYIYITVRNLKLELGIAYAHTALAMCVYFLLFSSRYLFNRNRKINTSGQ